jgi:uncharacterized BrkB/YihY/UPF0761 family membrane protein
LLATLAQALVTALSICWARGDDNRRRTVWGRRLFTLNLVIMGLLGVCAALYRCAALAPLGIMAGFLVVGMVWDEPTPSWREN